MSEQITGGEYVEPDTTGGRVPDQFLIKRDLPTRIPGQQASFADYRVSMVVNPLMTPPDGAPLELVLEHLRTVQDHLRTFMVPGVPGLLPGDSILANNPGLVRGKPSLTRQIRLRGGEYPDAPGTDYERLYALPHHGSDPGNGPIVIATGHAEHELPAETHPVSPCAATLFGDTGLTGFTGLEAEHPVVIGQCTDDRLSPTEQGYPFAGGTTPWARAEQVLTDGKPDTAPTGHTGHTAPVDVSGTNADDRDNTDSGGDG